VAACFLLVHVSCAGGHRIESQAAEVGRVFCLAQSFLVTLTSTPKLQLAPGLLSLAVEPEGTYPRSPPHVHDGSCRWGCVGVPFERLLVPYIDDVNDAGLPLFVHAAWEVAVVTFGLLNIVFAVGRRHSLQRACPCVVGGVRRHFSPVWYQFSWSTIWGALRSSRRPHLGHWW